MNKRLGNLLFLLGALCIAAAIFLTIHNRQEDQQAAATAEAVMPELAQEIRHQAKEWQSAGQTIDGSVAEKPVPESDQGVTVDGVRYLGYLEIPALNMQLPVQMDFSMDALKLSPCRYAGSFSEENLVIAAHNYSSSFGEISWLSAGDTVTLVDGLGDRHSYQVEKLETLSPAETERMTDSGWPLTLFTCTYGGASRTTVRCSKTE